MNRGNSKAVFQALPIGRRLSPGFSSLAVLCFALLLVPSPAAAEELSAFERCLMKAMQTADDSATMGELRRRCREASADETKAEATESTDSQKAMEPGALAERLRQERTNALEPFTLMAHRPNYFLFASYNASGINSEPYQAQSNDPSLQMDNTEAKFQLSIKTPLAIGLFDDRVDIFAAYTNRSFWQVYNDDQSSPFRESDHEPELWFQFRNDWQIFGFTNRVNAFGINHQSNGLGGVLSRSWNRLFADFVFERRDLAVSLRSWYRIPEDNDDDDNPDITDYMGHFEFRSAYKRGRNTFSLMLRNNLESGFRRGTVELGWSFPLWEFRFFRGYIQYFNGYGESLIDYDQHSNSIGAGLLLTDWL